MWQSKWELFKFVITLCGHSGWAWMNYTVICMISHWGDVPLLLKMRIVPDATLLANRPPTLLVSPHATDRFPVFAYYAADFEASIPNQKYFYLILLLS